MPKKNIRAMRLEIESQEFCAICLSTYDTDRVWTMCPTCGTGQLSCCACDNHKNCETCIEGSEFKEVEYHEN